MPKVSGKLVNSNGIRHGKNSARLSTWLVGVVEVVRGISAKASVIHQLTQTFPHLFSPEKITPLPLFEHYFYPVSTVPTIKATKENVKER